MFIFVGWVRDGSQIADANGARLIVVVGQPGEIRPGFSYLPHLPAPFENEAGADILAARHLRDRRPRLGNGRENPRPVFVAPRPAPSAPEITVIRPMLVAVIQEAWIKGVSTRKVEANT